MNFKSVTNGAKNDPLQIIVVNWNSGTQLAKCITSIEEHSMSVPTTVVVVDNNSTDHSADFLLNCPKILPIQSGSNLGFGKACNLGAANAKSEYLLFLNPDAALHKGTLEKVLAFMNDPDNSQVGICGVRLFDENGHVARHCARFPTALGLVAHAVGFDRIYPRFGHVMAEWDHFTTRKVDHVIGAFFLVRRQLFDELGGFDERFFVYLEDLDFSYRASLRGWQSVYFAEATAFHVGGGTSRNIKARRLFYSLRSRLLYAFKHFSWHHAVAVFLASILIEPISRSVLALIRRSWSSFNETWLAYGMLLCWLPQSILSSKTR